MSTRTIIMGAAGKDFHVFNTCYRDNADNVVVAFTAAQIPGIDDRRYPASLAGPHYPEGIPILPEQQLPALIKQHNVSHVVFAYSDITLDYVEQKAKLVRETGAEFSTFEVEPTMLPCKKPVIAVTAVRTGCGKSQTSRRVLELLREKGLKAVAIRHPMPYGDLEAQRVQRFETLEDLEKHNCTIEEMEEYEPHIKNGHVVYAGVDYGAIIAQAEQEADVVIWDGGNNDTPFYKPDLWIVVADALRPGHELDYFPGRTNFERADAIFINKIGTATEADVATVEKNAADLNPNAKLFKTSSPVTLEDSSIITGKRVLVVEDGPTLTHGGMKIGAGVVAAKRANAAEIVDPRPFVVGEIAGTFETYPDIGKVLPAMGYGQKQLDDLAKTIEKSDVDSVIIGTPIDLGRIIKIDKPNTRVTYELGTEADDYLREQIAKLTA